MKRKGWIIPVIAGLSVLMIGSGAFAATVSQTNRMTFQGTHTSHGLTGTVGVMGDRSGGSGAASALGGGYGMMGGGSGAASALGGGYGMMGGGSGAAGRMGGGYGRMGGGSGTASRMGGRMNAYSSLDSSASLNQQIALGKQGAVIDQKTNTITYSGGSINLVALASPHGKPNMTWEIDGLVNLTIIVPSSANVQVTLVNTDWGYMHGFEVTSTAPPYGIMAMMSVNSDFLLMPLPERTTKALATARYDTRSGQLHLSKGTYHYLCPMPGHANQGMYGTLKVV